MDLTESAGLPAAAARSLTRPSVTLSYAQSLDGSIAATRGMPLGLSSRESLKVTHKLRSEHDAILVGIGTVLADDPQLTVRLGRGAHPCPVILDSRLRTPPDARVLDAHPRRPLIATVYPPDPERLAALREAGSEVVVLPSDREARVDLISLLSHLSGIGVRSLMVEGGAAVITSFLTERCVDRVIVTIAPALVGGLHPVERLLSPASYRSPEDLAFSLEQFPRLNDVEVESVGGDLVVSGEIRWGTT